MPASDTDIAYISGFIDGEGYLGILRRYTKNAKRGYVLTPFIVVANTDRQVLTHIQSTLGHGKIYEKTRSNEHAKPVFHLQITAHGIRFILPTIIPHLRVKRQQAELLLKFVMVWHSEPHRYELYEQMRVLNARGNRCQTD